VTRTASTTFSALSTAIDRSFRNATITTNKMGMSSEDQADPDKTTRGGTSLLAEDHFSLPRHHAGLFFASHSGSGA